MAIGFVSPEIERMNKLLKDAYGQDTDTGLPMWRIVFSDDQFEKRESKFTPSGVELLFPQVQELPKYQHIRHKWILEQLVLVPDINVKTLVGLRKSYECLIAFHNATTLEPLPPNYEVAQFCIQMVYDAKNNAQPNVAKYLEDPEKALKELEKMHQYLWADETAISDHLMYGTGVSVPSNYSKD